MNRWWTYQKERFPLIAHGPLIAAFSASAVGYSSLLRGAGAQRSIASYVVAFLVSLGSFLLLRLADEFKDAEEDARHRPYRPVPRGLVRLSELRSIGMGVAVMQMLLCIWLGTRGGAKFGWQLPGLLMVTWVYFTLMSQEFFVRTWLKKRPVIYLFSHMLIMPLVDWFATGCDWVPSGRIMPHGLFWFLAASFCNGIVIELGRKIRAPELEEPGVETYSFLWGRPIAVCSWLTAMLATLGCGWKAATEIHFALPVLMVLTVLWSAATWLGVTFINKKSASLAKAIEAASALWTLALYLMLGVVPLLSK